MFKKLLITALSLSSFLFTNSSNAGSYENITVYYVSKIVDGDAYASPIGTIPKFDNDYVKKIKEKHNPDNTSYITETINDISLIFYWRNNGIEAVNFISEEEARNFHNFEAFPREDLEALDKTLSHFPRYKMDK